MTLVPKNNKKVFGHYLRKLRESSAASEFGFKTLSVRRTPGLRREELAQLCDVSTTWITLLEQGRSSPPSLKLIQKMINQLKLNQTQADYLLDLYVNAYNPIENQVPQDDFLGTTSDIERNEITQLLVTLVNSFSFPAYIIDPKWDMVCWNKPISTLFNKWLDAKVFFSHDNNLLNFIFLNDLAKENLPDWDYRARRSVAEFRNDSSSYKFLPKISNHIDYLLEKSEYFKLLWEKQDVLLREGVIKSFRNENNELIFFRQISTKIEAFPALRLILLIPQ